MKKIFLFFMTSILISLGLWFYFFTKEDPQSKENTRLFKQMCENKEYRIEIVDDNYTAEEIQNIGFYILNTDEFEKCLNNVDNCPKTTKLIHYGNVYLEKDDRLIARIYDVFLPFSKTQLAWDFEGSRKKGEKCGYTDIRPILIENLNKKDKK